MYDKIPDHILLSIDPGPTGFREKSRKPLRPGYNCTSKQHPERRNIVIQNTETSISR